MSVATSKPDNGDRALDQGVLLPVASPPQIVLSTLNARFIHASLGLRYLKANLDRHGRGGLEDLCVLREYTIKRASEEIAEDLIQTFGPAPFGQKQIVGFGVYIWNVAQTESVIRLLKQRRPELIVVVGGPEVSHELAGQAIVALADYVITGWGDVSFAKLCRALIDGPQPIMKVWAGEQPPMDDIELPYQQFSDDDLRHRVLYVEASRGCPFKCSFCLSALDKTAWAFGIDRFLMALDALYARGARQFKFVDRTFNLKIDQSTRILKFFLDKLSEQPPNEQSNALALHFEVVPDHLPDRLKALLVQFPQGVLQFELGIQTLNRDVQEVVSRKQDNMLALANIAWLKSNTRAHLHVDLIFGLPGETLESFAQGFDRLLAVGPDEIQLGLLKRLRGAPIAQSTDAFAMVYEPAAPYSVVQTSAVNADDIRHFKRVARYWDLMANSGRFALGLGLLFKLAPVTSAFMRFWAFSDFLWARQRRTDCLSPEILMDELYAYLCGHGLSPGDVRAALLVDYVQSRGNNQPVCLVGHLPRQTTVQRKRSVRLTKRQRQHAQQEVRKAL